MVDRFGADYPTMVESCDVEILVVEDSSTQATYLEQILLDRSYKVALARGGQEALEYLEKNTPTLVISDVVMPGMDGYELCTLIKEDPKLQSIPVILLTSLSDPADILKGLQCGADNFITKPYDDGALLSRIQYVLVNSQLRRRAVAGVGVEIYFAGRKHFLTAERLQIIDLLLSSFETAVSNRAEVEQVNRELRKLNQQLSREIEERKRAEQDRERLIVDLQEAFAQVKKLSGLLPICASCKKIRDDQGYWQQIEAYIRDHSEADFSHSICPDCLRKLYPNLRK